MSASLEFVDTNVLVYSIDHANPAKRSVARRLLARLWNDRTGCLSIQVLQEFYNSATSRLPNPMTSAAARTVVEDYSQWPVHSPTVQAVLASVDLQQTYLVSFWDSIILYSANYLGASVVWSEDLNHGQVYGNVVVRDPFI